MKKISKNFIVIGVLVFGCGIAAGWFSHVLLNRNNPDSQSLRLGGFKYINPLLVCDTSPGVESASLQPLQNKIKAVIEQEKADSHIETASVYFRDLSNGEQMSINPDEKFFPASLNKVPLMIALLKASENDPGLLQRRTTVSLSADYNVGQEIAPKDPVVIGQSYTAEELLTKMLRYSDNNAMYTLSHLLDQKIYESVYKDLGITYPQNMTEQPDFITAYDFAYFLRILYNSTYLKRDLSEKALGYLSDVDFSDGLKAGIPAEVTISHKFGLQTNIDGANGKVTSRQLHDCGIIYADGKPYMLCVMTKSTASLTEIEQAIKTISATVYESFAKSS